MRMWQFRDVVTNEVWVFPVNPNKMDPPFNTKNLTTYPVGVGGMTTWKAPTDPGEWSFGGVSRGQAMYQHLEAWCYVRKHEIEITDDLERVFRIYPVGVDFTPKRSRQDPWKHDYVFRGLLTQQHGGGIG